MHNKSPFPKRKRLNEIYKIGKQFGKTGLRIVKPDSNAIIDWGVDNTITINSFDFKLINGLVYSTVRLKKELLGTIVGPKEEKIEQSRLALSDFLNRDRSEVGKYGATKDEESKDSTASSEEIQ